MDWEADQFLLYLFFQENGTKSNNQTEKSSSYLRIWLHIILGYQEITGDE